ncbi:MAG: CBS domain-containing protein [Planctomycetota bacterium]
MPLICPLCGHENLDGTEACESCEQDLSHEPLPRPKEGIQKQLMATRLGELVCPKPVLVSPGASVISVIDRMRKAGLASALVVDRKQRVIGIFTDRDALQKCGADPKPLRKTPIRDFMTPHPVVLEEDAPLAYAVNRMSQGKFRHIPVTRKGKPMGVLSIQEIFHFLCREGE